MEKQLPAACCNGAHPAAKTEQLPRVIIVGAGMSGLSAAHRLTSLAPGRFQLTILEASERVGGRICTSVISDERVEMGATWIHGIEGSPVHAIARRMGAMGGGRDGLPWECMDGFPDTPVVKAEGGCEIHPHLVNSVGDLYKRLYSLIQHTEGGLQQFSDTQGGVLSIEDLKKVREAVRGGSVGAYLAEGLRRYLKAQEDGGLNGYSNGLWTEYFDECCHRAGSCETWSLRSLQKGIMAMRGNVERSVTGADSLADLDLDANEEYWEYPGEHMTIGHGYSSVIHFLAQSLPPGTIQFGKKVTRIVWHDAVDDDDEDVHRRHHEYQPVCISCEDGTLLQADHVVITVSLGVLKAHTQNSEVNCIDDSLFQPPLPPWKVDAISKLGFGVVDKCFLLMNKPASNAATYPHMQLVFHESSLTDNAVDSGAGVPWWMRKNFSFYPIHKASRLLCTWFTGKEAHKMESLTNKEVMDAVWRTMVCFDFKQVRDDVMEPMNAEHDDDGVPHISQIWRSSWGSNPLFRGSYSYVAAGASGNDIDTLAEPLPERRKRKPDAAPSQSLLPPSSSSLQLLFAGEATHRFCYSTTHGAFLSGLREAERLLSHYGLLLQPEYCHHPASMAAFD